MARIKIPREPESLLTLAADVYAKDQADGQSSPLNALVANKWSDIGSTIPQAQAAHREAERLRRLMEQEYAKRDLLLEPIQQTVRNSANLLKSIFANDPQKLGEWGFEVDSSPKSKPPTAP